MNATRILLEINRKDINYIRITLESYDGMALVRTVDPKVAIIEVYIAPKCEKIIKDLIDNLIDKEGLKIRYIA